MENKRIIILGETSSGKSTIIDKLKEKNYNVVTEVPRVILDLRKDFPINPEEIETKQKLMYDLQLHFEKIAQGQVFFERGLPCIAAFSQYYIGYFPKWFDNSICPNRYDKIFVLESLQNFVPDGTRIEKDENEARIIHGIVENFYNKFGYGLTRVPRFSTNKKKSIEKRVDFILKNI